MNWDIDGGGGGGGIQTILQKWNHLKTSMQKHKRPEDGLFLKILSCTRYLVLQLMTRNDNTTTEHTEQKHNNPSSPVVVQDSEHTLANLAEDGPVTAANVFHLLFLFISLAIWAGILEGYGDAQQSDTSNGMSEM
ncbi:hypothetical protein ACJX0J_023458, partial [Zea mays]